MKDLASVDEAAPDCHALDDGIVALVQWRLSDPAWVPSFADLLEDVRTCINPAAQPPRVLAALRDALRNDGALAPRARALAIEAQRIMAARDTDTEARKRPGPAPASLLRLADIRPIFFGG